MDLHRQAGIYLHIPFCHSKCNYCSFFSFSPQPGDMQSFVAALRQQILQLAALPEVQTLSFATLFIGGGTPSMLLPEILADLLDLCRRSFTWSVALPEISIEVNPGTIDEQGLVQLYRAGFNRLSIGIQSLDNEELRRLGRIHTREQALATISAAGKAGFANISCDLMYGLPGQSPRAWRQTLEEILNCAPQHLSLYELTVEEETPLWDQVEKGQCILPCEEDVLQMMSDTQLMTAQAGLGRYEISNYALPGSSCRHNLNYWHNGYYLGLGPGAVSALGGERSAAVADLHSYCRLVSGEQPVWKEVEQLVAEAAFRETVIMGLRMTEGISISGLQQRFAIDLPAYYGDVVTRLIDQGFLVRTGDSLRLSVDGLALANWVMAELV
ncbi:MAG: radical SAM family heme chaperone HemW [Desulfobulbus sp.]|nr:radical SAM family heme chaperone HemW [Desulfobulbus sp.]